MYLKCEWTSEMFWLLIIYHRLFNVEICAVLEMKVSMKASVNKC